jgi:hypothetical protein
MPLRGGINIAAAHRGFSYQPTDVFDARSLAEPQISTLIRTFTTLHEP